MPVVGTEVRERDRKGKEGEAGVNSQEHAS